jgi:epoxyqueuosine reductase QueG
MSYKDIIHVKPMKLIQSTYFGFDQSKPTLCGKKGKRYTFSWNINKINCPICLEKLNKKQITVCDNCLTASCWQGILMCENHKTAGTIMMTIEELRKLNREHSVYWIQEI